MALSRTRVAQLSEVRKMGVRYTKIQETATLTDMPSVAGPLTFTTGINAPGGPVEFLTVKYTYVYGATPVPAAGMSALINRFRIVLNGEVVHDFVASFSGPATAQASQFEYLINSIGGLCIEDSTGVPGTRDGFINIPLGQQTPDGVNRYEVTIGWDAAAAGAVIGAGSRQEIWLKLNSEMQTTTIVTPATSFLSSVSLEQVTVNVPQGVPGVVSALYVTNDAAVDDMAGLRINSLSDFLISPEMYRSDNGDTANGIMFNQGNTGAGPRFQQTFDEKVDGALFIPTYGLTGGNLVLSVDNTVAPHTRRYQPVITYRVGAKQGQEMRQTQASPGNTAKEILKGSLQ